MTDAEVVALALKSVARMGLRKAAQTLGVSHESVRRWREWDQRGAVEPMGLRTGTRYILENYLGLGPSVAATDKTYSDGVREAVRRVEDTLDELRELIGPGGGGDAEVVDASTPSQPQKAGNNQ